MQRLEERLLVAEAAIEAADRTIRGLGDVAHMRGVVAELGEDALAGLQQAVAGVAAARLVGRQYAVDVFERFHV